MSLASRAVALLQNQYESVFRNMRQSQWFDEVGALILKAKAAVTPFRHNGRDCSYRTMENLEPRLLMTTLYWDADAAAGLQAGSGAWDTTATNWNTAADGSGTRVAWIDGADAVFSTNGYSAVTISSSVMVSSLTFNASGYVITAHGTLNLVGSAAIASNEIAMIECTVAGESGVNVTGENELFLQGHLDYSGVTTISNGSVLQIDPYRYGLTETNLDSIINNGTLMLVGSTNHFLQVDGVISGIGDLRTFERVQLMGANTFTGVTKAYSGTLNIWNCNGLAGSTLDTSGSGSIFFGDGGSEGIITLGGLQGSGNIEINGIGYLTLCVGANNTNTVFSGSITSSAYTESRSFEKIGTGILTLDGNNLFWPDLDITIVQSGTIKIASSSVLPSNADVALYGTLELDADLTIGFLQGDGVITLIDKTLTLCGKPSLNGDVGVFYGTINGTGGVTLSNNAQVLLLGNNIYTGSTIINAGCYLQFGEPSHLSIGTIYSSSIINNGELQFCGSGALSEQNIISGNGILDVSSGILAIRSSNTFAGTVRSFSGTILFQNSLAFQYATFSGDTSTYQNFFDFGDLATVTIGGISGSFNLWNSNLYQNIVEVLVGNNNLDQTYSGNIQANINLVKVGAGKLTLTANNFNGTTIIEEGTLQIGAGSTGGTLGTGDVINNANLIINRSNALTISNNISGTGTITKDGAGALTLSGNNSFNGITTISRGTVTLSGGSALLNSVVELANVSGVKLMLSDNETIGALSGGGTTGGNVVLGSYSLKIGSDNPYYIYTKVYSGVISGTGALILNGCWLVLTGANTYSGGTSISSYGTLQIGGLTDTGSIGTGAIWNGGGLKFARTNAITFANVIGGNGFVSQLGTGTLTLTGANTYSGETYIGTNCTLQVGAGSTAGTLGTGNVYNYGNLTINRSNAYAVANSISGTGSLTKAGAGALTLSGVNTFTGTTTINAGSLILSGGTALSDNSDVVLANASSAKLVLADNETIGSLSGGGTTGGYLNLASYELNVINNDDTTYAGVISGTGSIVKSGSGRLTLTRTNTYTGTTTVTSGILNVSGSLVSNVSVMSGATLTGTGTITGDVLVNSGGIIGPTNGLGVLHLKNLTLSAGSTVVISINSNTAGTGYGQISISGLLAINGATLFLSGTRNTASAKTLTLFNCTSTSAISGTFNGFGQDSAVDLNNLHYTVSYTGGNGNDFVLIDQ